MDSASAVVGTQLGQLLSTSAPLQGCFNYSRILCAGLGTATNPTPASLALYNPLSWPRTDAVELIVPASVGLRDSAGNPIACQVDTISPGLQRVTFELTSAAMSVDHVDVSTTAPLCTAGVPDTAPYIENEFIRLDFDSSGRLQHWTNLATGTRLNISVAVLYYTAKANNENAWYTSVPLA